MAAPDRSGVRGSRAVAWLARAGAFLAVLPVAAPAVAADAPSATDVAGLVAPALTRALELFWIGIERQPGLMLAGAVASAVPLVGGLAAIVRAIGRGMRRRALARQHAELAPVTTGRRPNLAWLQIENQRSPPLRLGELARIGGSADCDLALGNTGAPGIHAVIQRTPDSEFVIFDVSDESESGLAVNGTPSKRCRLHDGDRIEIGGTCVVFHAKWTGGTGEQTPPG
ncbi:MAG: FHA domain-containing protein [Hyphomicrobiaceae bacterium]